MNEIMIQLVIENWNGVNEILTIFIWLHKITNLQIKHF